MSFLVVTGLSGAGKSQAVNALEDIGYFCIDNIPAALLPKILEFAQQGDNALPKVAVVIDVRGLHSREDVASAISSLDSLQIDYKILFLDASDECPERRYKETRRMHPISLSHGLAVGEAIRMERSILQPLYERANYVIDTTLLSTAQHKQRICDLFLEGKGKSMALNIISFGFKFGLPKEADIVLDVRCLPNPFYVPELKEKTGLDQEVVDFVMSHPEAVKLMDAYKNMLDCSLPLYVKEGKSLLTIAVGCTGGKHRSITFARLLADFCREKGYAPSLQHRDVQRKN